MLLSVILGISVLAGAGESSTGPQSLAELDSTALVLRMAFDGERDLGCGIEHDEASELLRLIEAQIDDKKRDLLRDPYGKGWPSVLEMKNCQRTCHCGVFSDLIETYSPIRKQFEPLVKAARKKAQAQGVRQSKSCAKLAQWVCGSPYLKSLKEEKKNSPH